MLKDMSRAETKCVDAICDDICEIRDDFTNHHAVFVAHGRRHSFEKAVHRSQQFGSTPV